MSDFNLGPPIGLQLVRVVAGAFSADRRQGQDQKQEQGSWSAVRNPLDPTPSTHYTSLLPDVPLPARTNP